MLDQKTLVKNIMTGKDGKLLIVIDNKSEELLEIDTYSIKGNYTNLDYQPVGSYQKFGVPSDVSYTLTFTEAVVRDDVHYGAFAGSCSSRKKHQLQFQGDSTET